MNQYWHDSLDLLWDFVAKHTRDLVDQYCGVLQKWGDRPVHSESGTLSMVSASYKSVFFMSNSWNMGSRIFGKL